MVNVKALLFCAITKLPIQSDQAEYYHINTNQIHYPNRYQAITSISQIISNFFFLSSYVVRQDACNDDTQVLGYVVDQGIFRRWHVFIQLL